MKTFAYTADHALFRTIQCVVNPLAGQSVVVAALVLDSDGHVSPLLAPRTVHAECLGNTRAAALIRLMQPTLNRLDNFDELPGNQKDLAVRRADEVAAEFGAIKFERGFEDEEWDCSWVPYPYPSNSIPELTQEVSS
jgi:hypothetical protein